MPSATASSAGPPRTRPLRVLHLTLASDAGGLTRYITTLGTAMSAQGHDITAAGDVGAWQREFDAAPFPYLQIPLKEGLRGMGASVARMRGWISDHPVDLIHTHYRRATLLARRLVRALPRDRRPPILYTLHLSHIDLRGWRRWLSDFGDHTHLASRDAQQWLEAEGHVSPGRITLIPHGIDVARFPQRSAGDRLAARASLGLPADATVAAFVGRFEHPKNESWCATALARAHGQAPNLHLLYCGQGPREPELRDLAQQLRGRVAVHLLGHIDPLPVYQASDVLLLPSEREGFSLVCAEALSVGVPHVRTRTSGASELTVEGETGLSTPIDRTSFESAAARLLALPAEMGRMGENGARLIRERFTFERQVEQTLDLYRKLSAGAAAAGRRLA